MLHHLFPSLFVSRPFPTASSLCQNVPSQHLSRFFYRPRSPPSGLCVSMHFSRARRLPPRANTAPTTLFLFLTARGSHSEFKPIYAGVTLGFHPRSSASNVLSRLGIFSACFLFPYFHPLYSTLFFCTDPSVSKCRLRAHSAPSSLFCHLAGYLLNFLTSNTTLMSFFLHLYRTRPLFSHCSRWLSCALGHYSHIF